MTFWKFFIIVLVIYIVYYSVILLLEKIKTQKSGMPITSKRVDFVVEQPKPAMAPAAPNEALKFFEIETDEEEDNEVATNEPEGTDNQEENNIFDDLGIEAYFSNSIDVTEDNLLTLINE